MGGGGHVIIGLFLYQGLEVIRFRPLDEIHFSSNHNMKLKLLFQLQLMNHQCQHCSNEWVFLYTYNLEN